MILIYLIESDMKVLCYMFLIYLIVGTLAIIGVSIYTILTYKRDKSKKSNYGYPYLGFNNPLMDGFE